jgi:hypothetical protein
MRPDQEQTASPRRPQQLRFYLALLMLSLALTGVLAGWATGAASPLAYVMQRATPAASGGHGLSSDGRNDIDIYPSAAFDAATQRYLVVWMSTRRADSSSDGFDVFGKFLDTAGQPLGEEFLISDQNNVARSGRAAVAASPDGFLVVWARGASRCELAYQVVNDGDARTDGLLLAASAHVHSPSLVYNVQRGHYVVAYTEGDDYLPPKLFGASTSTCGDNPTAASAARALEFHLAGGAAQVDGAQVLSAVAGGAFRPSLAFDARLNQYLIAWEDRRNAAGQPYRFDVYAQILNADLTRAGGNLVIQAGADYTNLDQSATWTPRPAVTAGEGQLLVGWYERQVTDGLPRWLLHGRFLSSGAALSTPFTIAQMTFAESHPDSAPSGFVDLLYSRTAQEYIAAMTSQLESVFGYFSTVRLQRIDTTGRLLRMNGNRLSTPAVGTAIDYDYDSQISVTLARQDSSYRGDLLAVYGKHAPNRQSQDFDIWAVPTWFDVGEPPTPVPTDTPRVQNTTLYLPAIRQDRK